jgi:hypothetical protein
LERAYANFLFDSQVEILNSPHLSINRVKPLPTNSYKSFILTTNWEYLFFGIGVWELNKFIYRVNYVPTAIVGFTSFGLIKSIAGREFSQRCDRLDEMGED